MGRPKKEVTAVETVGAVVAPAVTHKEEAKQLSPTEMATKRIAAKKAALEKMEADTFAEANELAEKYSKSKHAPIFLPFKDRDGKIVPALLLGSSIGEKRDEGGELVLNEGREITQECKLSVWVFSNNSEPHRATYKAPENF